MKNLEKQKKMKKMDSTPTSTFSYPEINWPSVSTTVSSVPVQSGWTVCAGQTCSSDYYLDTFGVTPEMYGVKQEEGNNPMNYATATVQAGTTETQDQRKYLTKRLETVYYEKESPLYAQFGLSDDLPPAGPKEIAERLKEGKYTIKGADKDDEFSGYRYWGIGDLIRWRDPAKKADTEGYEAALKDLNAKRQAALDTIKIDEPKAGLDAIKALEAWTPTGAAN